ncbi:MAG: YbhN family protein, partial [Gemmatimonadota bacterium]
PARRPRQGTGHRPRARPRGPAAPSSPADAVPWRGGLGAAPRPRRFALVFAWTLAHWLLNALAFWLGFEAVGITLPFSAANFLQGVIAIGVALPSSPGFFGVFESVAKAGLGVYGVAADRAVAWAFGYHLLTYVPVTVIGALYFTRLGLSLGQMARDERAAEASA